MTLAHGGNIYEVSSRLQCSPDDILDYSASINPLGPPAGLIEEFHRYFHRLQHYPDIHNHALRHSLAEFHGLSPDQVVVGNGSTELIYWMPRVLDIKRAVVVLPTFSEYRKAFDLQGVELGKLVTSADRGFQPHVEEIESMCNAFSPEAILLTNPGSPAGTLLDHAVRRWLLEESRGIICFLDEVFVDFCEGESLKSFLEEAPNVLIIRSMTKFYGIPGLRLGYLLCSKGTAARVNHFLPPWSVNTLAQIAGNYCLRQDDYRRETLELIGRERLRMQRELEGMRAFSVFPGAANYLLIKLDAGLPPADVFQRDLLLSHRILIRDCRSFEGLDDRYVRVAIRLPEQNTRLLEGIAKWVATHTH